MLIVPLAGDTITTKEGETFSVISYTNYKTKGPAVHVKPKVGRANVLVYFFDIEQINGARVEFQTSSKVFEALGHIKRKVQLPQKNDVITISDKTVDGEAEEKQLKVKDLKLHNKSIGLANGLVVIDEDGDVHRLDSINDIKRAIGGDTFSRNRFLRTYKEYLGYTGK